MTRARPTIRTLILALAAAALSSGSVRAQDTYTYRVQESDRGVRWPEGSVPTLDVTGDPDPREVIQGPEFTWVVREGDSLAVRQAIMVLHANVPIRPEAGGLMVQGWPGPRTSPYDSVTLRLDRGRHDRSVAGRPARHYVLRAAAFRTGPDAGTPRRLEFTAHFWILPGIPHSWAPFGYGSEGLPGLVPRLRDELDRRLTGLGLVGRAIIRLEYRSGEAGSVDERKLTGFEISGLETADPPPVVRAVVPRALLATLRERVLEDPGALCPDVAGGRIADPGARDLDSPARKAILARLNDRCASPEVYRGLVEPRLRADAAPFCATVAEAADPESLVRAVLTDAQATSFMEFLSETDRARFLAELRQYCDGRPEG